MCISVNILNLLTPETMTVFFPHLWWYKRLPKTIMCSTPNNRPPCFLNASWNFRSMTDRIRLQTMPSQYTSKHCQNLTAITNNDKHLQSYQVAGIPQKKKKKKIVTIPANKCEMRNHTTLLCSDYYRKNGNFLPLKLLSQPLLHCFSIFSVNI